jgi:hypothetical protein
VSFAATTLCVASQLVFSVVDFVIDSVRKLLDKPSYSVPERFSTSELILRWKRPTSLLCEKNEEEEEGGERKWRAPLACVLNAYFLQVSAANLHQNNSRKCTELCSYLSNVLLTQCTSLTQLPLIGTRPKPRASISHRSEPNRRKEHFFCS